LSEGVLPHLSIIVPAHNEEERIGPTLERVAVYLAAQSYAAEVIVVDDVSADRTGEVVDAFAATHPIFRRLRRDADPGKGAAVRAGMLAAKGDYRLFTDADNSTPIEETAKLLAACERNFEVAVASRALPESNLAVRQPWYREAMGRTFNLMVQVGAVWGIHDTQCGFKCFRGAVAEELFSRMTITGWAFDVEILFLARKRGYRIAEIPVTWINSPKSRVSPIRDSLRMMRDLLRIRWRSLRGVYRQRGGAGPPAREPRS
jgi:dolichyl-phosphate beta-glucosyltransferase